MLIVTFACFLTTCIDNELVESTVRKVRLEEKDKNLESMLHHFPEGVAFYDRSQKTLYSNPYWDAVNSNLNYIRKSLSTSSLNLLKQVASVQQNNSLVDILVKKEDSRKTLSKLLQDLSEAHLKRRRKPEESTDGDSDDIENMVINKNDSDFILKAEDGKVLKEYSVKIVKSKYFDGQPSLLCILNDVTDRMKLRDEKISGKIKTMMLCSISHELRTPLNQINGMMFLAKSLCKNPKITYYLDIAQNSSNFLLSKIDDILDYYEIETNNFNAHITSFNLANFLGEIKESFMQVIDNRTKKLSILMDKGVPDFISHDSRRIKQVLHNIISNAIKYTEKGFILVTVDWEKVQTKSSPISGKKSRDYNYYLKFQVSDSGSGIEKGKEKYLYDLFGNDQQNSDNDGSQSATKLAGLGLSIAQKILIQMRSRLHHRSSVNVGSKFWFKLKIDEFDFEEKSLKE